MFNQIPSSFGIEAYKANLNNGENNSNRRRYKKRKKEEKITAISYIFFFFYFSINNGIATHSPTESNRIKPNAFGVSLSCIFTIATTNTAIGIDKRNTYNRQPTKQKQQKKWSQMKKNLIKCYVWIWIMYYFKSFGAMCDVMNNSEKMKKNKWNKIMVISNKREHKYQTLTAHNSKLTLIEWANCWGRLTDTHIKQNNAERKSWNVRATKMAKKTLFLLL